MASEKSILEEFLVESEEHLIRFEEILLAMERESEPKSSVHELLRAVHSIKGGAAFLGFGKLNRLSHAMETVLVRLRDDVMQMDPALADLLLKGQDLIREMFARMDRMEEVDTDAYIGELMRVEAERGRSSKPEPLKTSQRRGEAEGSPYRMATAEWGEGKIELWLERESCGRISCEKLLLLIVDLLNQPDPPCPQGPAGWMIWLNQRGKVHGGQVTTADVSLRKSLPLTPLLWHCLIETEQVAEELLSELGVGGSDPLALHRVTELNWHEEEPVAVLPEMSEANAAENPAEMGRGNEGELEDRSREEQRGEEVDGYLAMSRSETLRVPLGLIDELMRLAMELVLTRNQVTETLRADPEKKELSKRLNQLTTSLQESILRTRMQPLTGAIQRLQRVVRDLSRRLGKAIDLVVEGEQVEVDKNVLDGMIDPLMHLVRNACDHGIEDAQTRLASGKHERGRIQLRAFHDAGQIHLEIRDDGAGMDPLFIRRRALERGLRDEATLDRMSREDLLNLIFLPGFSTAETVSDVSGRGVGLDVVRTNVERLGGIIQLESSLGRGSVFRLRLPLTLLIVPCLTIAVKGARYAIPRVHVLELGVLYDLKIEDSIERVNGQELFLLRDVRLPLVRFDEVLARPSPFTEETRRELAEKYGSMHERRRQDFLQRKQLDPDVKYDEALRFAVLQSGLRRFVLTFDEVLKTEEVVVRPLHSALSGLRCFSGVTLLGDGRPSLVLNAPGLIEHVGVRFETGHSRSWLRKRVETQVMLFRLGDQRIYALPIAQVRRVVELEAESVAGLMADPHWYGEEVPVPILGACVEEAKRASKERESGAGKGRRHLLLVRDERVGILLDQVLGVEKQELEFLEREVPHEFFGIALVKGQECWFADMYAFMQRAGDDRIFADGKGEVFFNQGNECEASVHLLAFEPDPLARRALARYLEPCTLEFHEEWARLTERLKEGSFQLVLVSGDPESPELQKAVKEWRMIDKRIPILVLQQKPIDRSVWLPDPEGYDALVRIWDRDSLRGCAQKLLQSGRKLKEEVK